MLLPRSRAVHLHVYHHHPRISRSPSRPLAVAVRCSDTMPKAPRVYFAVRVGREPGIYETWEECRKQVVRYPHAVFKKLKTLDAATAWVNECDTPDPMESDIEPADSLSQTMASVSPSSLTKASHSSSTIAPTPVTRPSNPPLSATAGPSKPTGFSSSTAFEDVVYTDGACSRNGQAGSVAGVGVWWGPNDPRNISERCPGSPQTNNRAELIAIIRALQTAPTSPIPLVIKTDSKYAMKCIDKWLPLWRKNNFRTSEGRPVKNSELIMYADALTSMRKKAGQEVRFEHVAGHAGEPGNEGADKLAVSGCELREVSTPNWGELRLQLEKKMRKKKTAVIVKPKVETVDASMFADMILDKEQLLAELEES
ncbi:ribonuclease H-like domain-containing protein [Lactarius akahatsu]|uniref:ribonuclease H n=1 Tax=Lactarius akahatsu TaxID=416441 RepID=A0AAD4LH03_9AGAM|nr:ribonuclease H-like domain-containing protein [Lactarius akahatsu]